MVASAGVCVEGDPRADRDPDEQDEGRAERDGRCEEGHGSACSPISNRSSPTWKRPLGTVFVAASHVAAPLKCLAAQRRVS